MAPDRIEETVVQYDVPCTLSDGTILRANIARPAGSGRWPVILVRTPYGKDSAHIGMNANMTSTVRRGFVVVVVDARQRGGSEGAGDYLPFVNDGPDGADTIAWAAALACSNGDVFTFGISYCGWLQWAAAARTPPALRAMVPICAPSTMRRSLLYRGGALELHGVITWFMLIGFETLIRRLSHDPSALRIALGALAADFDRMWEDDAFNSLPINRFEPLTRNHIGQPFLDLLGATDDAPMIEAMTKSQDYENIEVPALIIGGWYDYFVQGSIDQFVGMRERGGNRLARQGTRLIMGPWSHQATLDNQTGERVIGMSAGIASMNRDDTHGIAAEFFEGIIDPEARSDAPVRIFVMGANVWRDEQEWPLRRAIATPWYLASGGHANSAQGDGRIAPERLSTPSDHFSYDPANPVPTRGGNCMGLTALAGPRDQRRIEERDDVLVYTSEPLDHDLEVTGTVVAEIWATTNVEDTDFVVRLIDVHPDGTALGITEGIVRARYRHNPESFAAAQPLEPGKPYLFRIEMLPTSNMFKAGHRLRVDVTSSSFPRWARNLNIWDEFGGTLADARVARQEILHDQDHMSRVVFPIIPPAL